MRTVVTTVVSLVLVAVSVPWAAVADAAPLVARVVPRKPPRTVLGPGVMANRVVVKFSEGSGVRLRGDRWRAAGLDLQPFEEQLKAAGAVEVRRLFSRSEEALDAERAVGQARSGRALADLNLYVVITLPTGANGAALCDALNALPYVERAELAPVQATPPVDLAPPTSDYAALQGYRSPAPLGIGVLNPLLFPGSDGAGMAVADCETSWRLDHEDLELPPSAMINTGTPFDILNDRNHGTAVLGELVGKDNGYGITGIVPAATAYVAPVTTAEYLYDVARAVNLSSAVLTPGDAILIEQHNCVCNLPCSPLDPAQINFGPMEWYQPIFDAISTATALGIVVVEAAGNGGVDLDRPECQGLFDPAVRDSGAILVGGGDWFLHYRLYFSDYGRRVDLQGWGGSVATTGYGDLFDPSDERQRYTQYFGGTSSASPIVTGAVLSIQGVRQAAGFPPYTAAQVRDLLASTGTPQYILPPFAEAEHIGPLPDLQAAGALAQTCGDGTLDAGESCDDGNVVNADGCDLNCTVSACGNGVRAGAEECDDGNVLGGDGCDANCEIEQPCHTHPHNGCRAAGKSLLLFKDRGGAGNKLKWKWLKGAATDASDYGAPQFADEYALCVYAGTAATRVAQAIVPPSTHWTPGAARFDYADDGSFGDGLTKISLRAGTAGKAKILVGGKGSELDMPDLSSITAPVRVQLVRTDTGLCWDASYAPGAVIQSTPALFKAKASYP